MEATVQLNARMSRDLKKAGDDALALIGLSPSAAVRALWAKAAKRGEDLEQVAQLLTPVEAAAPVSGDDDPFAEIHAQMDTLYRQLGIDPSKPSIRDYDDKELLAEALYERMVERGLM